MSLFDMNGPLMNALRTLANIFLCNVMFCLLSLPLVTIGASLSALFTCMQAILAEDEEDVIVKQYWTAFKQNLKQATGIWLICLLVFAFLGIYHTVISNMGGSVEKVYRISFFMMCLIFLFGFQYFFPLQARYENKTKDILKNAYLLSIAALPWTLLSIGLVIGAVYLSFFMNPNGLNLAVFLWGTLGFGLVAYLNSFFFRKAFQLIDPKVMQVKHEAPKEAIFTDEEHRTTEVLYQESRYSRPDWNRQSFPGAKHSESSDRTSDQGGQQ